jgi:hypothetical protein
MIDRSWWSQQERQQLLSGQGALRRQVDQLHIPLIKKKLGERLANSFTKQNQSSTSFAFWSLQSTRYCQSSMSHGWLHANTKRHQANMAANTAILARANHVCVCTAVCGLDDVFAPQQLLLLVTLLAFAATSKTEPCGVPDS